MAHECHYKKKIKKVVVAQARHRPGCIASLRDPKWRRRVSETVFGKMTSSQRMT